MAGGVAIEGVGEVFGRDGAFAAQVDQLEGESTVELLIAGEFDSELFDLSEARGTFFSNKIMKARRAPICASTGLGE